MKSTDSLREQLRKIVTRNGNSVRIPEILEAELDDLVALYRAQSKKADLYVRNEVQAEVNAPTRITIKGKTYCCEDCYVASQTCSQPGCCGTIKGTSV